MIEYTISTKLIGDLGSTKTQRELMNRIKDFVKDYGTENEITIIIKKREEWANLPTP
jgi:hypothetical protein